MARAKTERKESKSVASPVRTSVESKEEKVEAKEERYIRRRIEPSDHNRLGTALGAGAAPGLIVQQMMQVKEATRLLAKQISDHPRGTDLDGFCNDLHRGFEDAIETCNQLRSGRFAPRDSRGSRDAGTHYAHESIHAVHHAVHYIHIDKEKKVLRALCEVAGVCSPPCITRNSFKKLGSLCTIWGAP